MKCENQWFWNEGFHKPGTQRWLVMLSETLDGISIVIYFFLPYKNKTQKNHQKPNKKNPQILKALDPKTCSGTGTGKYLRGFWHYMVLVKRCDLLEQPVFQFYFSISPVPATFVFPFSVSLGTSFKSISFPPRLRAAAWAGLADFQFTCLSNEHRFLIYMSWYWLCTLSTGMIHSLDFCRRNIKS